MDKTGHKLLAGSALARYQHRRIGFRYLGGQIKHLLHRPALAYRQIFSVKMLQLAPEINIFIHQPFPFESPVYQKADLVWSEGLGDVFVRPLLDRLDSGLNRRVAGDHENDRTRVIFLDSVQQSHPIHPGHLDIADHHVKQALAKFL